MKKDEDLQLSENWETTTNWLQLSPELWDQHRQSDYIFHSLHKLGVLKINKTFLDPQKQV